MKYQRVLKNGGLFITIETIGSKSSQLHRYVLIGDFKNQVILRSFSICTLLIHIQSFNSTLGFWIWGFF